VFLLTDDLGFHFSHSAPKHCPRASASDFADNNAIMAHYRSMGQKSEKREPVSSRGPVWRSLRKGDPQKKIKPPPASPVNFLGRRAARPLECATYPKVMGKDQANKFLRNASLFFVFPHKNVQIQAKTRIFPHVLSWVFGASARIQAGRLVVS
jgi:hypothetical protein